MKLSKIFFAGCLLASTLFVFNAGAVCTPPVWEMSPLPPDGLLKYRTTFSPALNGNATYIVYLPPSYATSPTRRYPVLYWLHGGGSNAKSGSGFVSRADTAMRAGQLTEVIIVLPNGPQTMWTDSKPGATLYNSPIETFIIDELIPLIDANYRTIATREGRGIEGFSMGGKGSSRLGLKHWAKFGLMSALAGALNDWNFFAHVDPSEVTECVYADDENYFIATMSQTHAVEESASVIAAGGRYRIVVGTADTGRQNYANSLAFHDLLTTLGIAHEFIEVAGVKHSYQNLYDVGGAGMWSIFNQAWSGLQ